MTLPDMDCAIAGSRVLRAALPQLLLWCTLSTSGPSAAQTLPAPAPAQPAESLADCTKAARDQVFHELSDVSRYAAANVALTPPRPRERRVIFMGDSITDSWSTVDPKFFARPDYIDRGIGGQTTMQMLLRFRQDVIALKPAVVHIMAGTNDIAGNTGPTELPIIEANVASMAELARANGIQVVIGSVLPAAEFRWRPGLDPGPKIVALNEWLKRYANEKRLIYVDYHAALNDGALGIRSGLSTDGVHPTLAGYLIMDPLAEAAIRTALRRRAPAQPKQ